MYSTRTQQITWLYSQQLYRTHVHVGAQRNDSKCNMSNINILNIENMYIVRSNNESVLVYKMVKNCLA